ncbi:MAG: hypothetical protein JWQ76_1398 [Ramlibacter sp.]|nr:hypothetical protein [Ramlibacter sp.]
MKDGPTIIIEREAPRRRASDSKGSSPRKQRDFVSRATARGHSGSGSASVLPHLRDQLRLKALLPTPFPLSEQLPGKNERHQ